MLLNVVLNCVLLLGTNVPNASGAVGQTRVIQRIPHECSSMFDSTELHVSSNGDVYVLVGYFRGLTQYYHLHTIKDGEWSETAVGLTGDDLVLDVHGALADDQYYLYMFPASKLKVYRTLDEVWEDRPLWQARAGQGLRGELVPLAPDRGDVLLLNTRQCSTSNPLAWLELFRSFGHGGFADCLCSVVIRSARYHSLCWRPGPVENVRSDLRFSTGWLLEKDCLHVAWERRHVGCFYATINVENNSWERPIFLGEGSQGHPSVGRQGESIYCAWYNEGKIDVARITGGKVTRWPGEQRGCGPRLVQARDGRLILFWLDQRGVNYRWCTEDGTSPVHYLKGPVDPNSLFGPRNIERFFHVAAAASGDLHILSARRYEGLGDVRAGHPSGLEIRYTLISAEALQKAAPR